MRPGLRPLHFAATLLIAACQTAPPPPPVPLAERPAGEEWKGVILDEDQDRFDRLDLAWSEALETARRRGQSRQVASHGALFVPDAGLPRAAPPPGPYHCRLFRFASRGRPFEGFRSYYCHVVVEGRLLAFTKQDGSERPGGYLWADSDLRQIFLGALARGAEPLPPGYRQRPDRDLVGVLERIGPLRYRLSFPWPRSGATLDVIELVPAPQPID